MKWSTTVDLCKEIHWVFWDLSTRGSKQVNCETTPGQYDIFTLACLLLRGYVHPSGVPANVGNSSLMVLHLLSWCFEVNFVSLTDIVAITPGAIMFGDPLLPAECRQLVSHLKRTSLCFQVRLRHWYSTIEMCDCVYSNPSIPQVRSFVLWIFVNAVYLVIIGCTGGVPWN